ncbi:MAG TPA: hypothetical protein VGP36_07270 [Mycobacteriales bacterium]|jgi:hypothetical protein|nr:hypothetical protein [Mycobacteriales bacterium]
MPATFRRPALIAAAATALLAAGAVTVAAGSPADAASRPQVLRFGVQFSPFTIIDVPPLQTGDGDFRPGDYTVFSDVLTDRAGRTVGTEGGTGVITKVDSTGVQLNYTVSLQLAGGQITAQGLASTDPGKHLAITGGTGPYTGAAGRFDLTELGDGTGTLTLTLG